MDPAFRQRAELAVKLVFLALAGLVGLVLALAVWRDRSYQAIGMPAAQPISGAWPATATPRRRCIRRPR